MPVKNLLEQIKRDYPEIIFEPAGEFRWNPETRRIFYNENFQNSDWSLLHEIGHMELNHKNYTSDFCLLKMEAQAWHKAEQLAEKYRVEIDKEHITKCLDSYRDWLYQRSKCRQCAQAGIERVSGQYSCLNCGFAWQVTPERFCRVYRRQIYHLDI